MVQNSNSIIFKNEVRVNQIASIVNISSFFVAFPLMILFTLLHVFKLDLKSLAVNAIISGVIIFTPQVLIKLKTNASIIKYINIIATNVVIFVLAKDVTIGINLTYLVPIAVSCLYFDKTLMKMAFVLGLVNIVGSQYLKLSGTSGYMGTVLGYVVEYIVLTIIFAILSRRVHHLLTSLVDSEENANNMEKLSELVDKSKDASITVANYVKQLFSNVNEAAESNDFISKTTFEAANGSKENLKYIEDTAETLNKISELVKNIAEKTEDINNISKMTKESSENSEKAIGQVTKIMNELDAVSKNNIILIGELKETTNKVDSIIDLISGIAQQTNMLALNASIESARAGEHGKGFSVVSEEIKVLSDESARATKDISKYIKKMKKDAQSVIDATELSTETIKNGITTVNEAGNIFGSLKKLQDSMNLRIEEVVDSSHESSKYGEDINIIVKNIKDITINSLDKIEFISDSTQKQTSLMQEIQSSFSILEKTALELKKIAVSE